MISPFQLLPAEELQWDLHGALDALRGMPLETLLERHGLLRPLARETILKRLRQEARLSDEEKELIREQGQARSDQVRLLRWMEEHYGPQVEARFLQRQQDLEQVVFRTLRLHQLGLAEELYLRLLGREESFGDVAARHSIGEERYTRGLLGPMPISQPHPTIRRVLERLKIGDVSPPFTVENTILILRLEHRLPARLDEAMRQRLLQELMQNDLEAFLDTVLDPWLKQTEEKVPAAHGKETLQR